MNEEQYLFLNNRVNISIAIIFMRLITPGEKLGVDNHKHLSVLKILLSMQEDIFKAELINNEKEDEEIES